MGLFMLPRGKEASVGPAYQYYFGLINFGLFNT